MTGAIVFAQMALALPFLWLEGPEEFKENTTEAVPCTPEDNTDYDYDTPIQEESFREDKCELVVK